MFWRIASISSVLAALSVCPAWAQQTPAAPAARSGSSVLQGAPQLTTPPGGYAGTLQRVSVHGPSLVGNLEGDSPDRMVSIYLPPSYAKQPTRRYPVLYMLHGFTDSDTRWFGLRGPHFVNLPSAVDQADAHGARELIVVMPDAFTHYQGSMYSNSVTTGNWEAFITRDLVRYIDTHYRTLAVRASRGLAGHSMGGYGTLRLAMKYPGVFTAIYALSPCCLGANLTPDPKVMQKAAHVADADLGGTDFGTLAMLASAAAWSPDPKKPPHYFDLPVEDGKANPTVIAAWAANAPLAMLFQYVPNLRTYTGIAVDAGDRDAFIAPTVTAIDQLLSGFGIEHVAEIYPGNHVDHIQQRLIEKVLPFFSRHLKFD